MKDWRTQDFKELDVVAIATGIGRKATEAELIDYLSRESDIERLDLEIAFFKYLAASEQ